MNSEHKKALDANTAAIERLTADLAGQGSRLGTVEKGVSKQVLEGEKSQRDSRENWDFMDRAVAKYNAKWLTLTSRLKTYRNTMVNIGKIMLTNQELTEQDSTMMTRGLSTIMRTAGKYSDMVQTKLGGERKLLSQQRESWQEKKDNLKANRDSYSTIGYVVANIKLGMEGVLLTMKGILLPIATLALVLGGVSLFLMQEDSPLYKWFLNADTWDRIAGIAAIILTMLFVLGGPVALMATAVGAVVLLLTTEMAPALAGIVALVGAIATYFALAAFFTVGLPVALGIAAVFLAGFIWNQRDAIVEMGRNLWDRLMQKMSDWKHRFIMMFMELLNNKHVRWVADKLGWNNPYDTYMMGYNKTQGGGNNIQLTNNFYNTGSPAMTASAVGRSVDSALQTNAQRQNTGYQSRGSMA